jgi:hypothetical protein
MGFLEDPSADSLFLCPLLVVDTDAGCRAAKAVAISSGFMFLKTGNVSTFVVIREERAVRCRARTDLLK